MRDILHMLMGGLLVLTGYFLADCIKKPGRIISPPLYRKDDGTPVY